MHPNKIVDKNHDDLRANVDAAGEHLTALWSELRIPLTGEKWNEAEAVVIALRNIIDDTRGALPPKHDPIRAAKAEAWQEGLMVGFGQGQDDASGNDYEDTPNPYKD